MEKIQINPRVSRLVKEYARARKISFQKACEKLFDAGVCHLQKKDDSFVFDTAKDSSDFFCAGVCHPRRAVRTITITETVEVA